MRLNVTFSPLTDARKISSPRGQRSYLSGQDHSLALTLQRLVLIFFLYNFTCFVRMYSFFIHHLNQFQLKLSVFLMTPGKILTQMHTSLLGLWLRNVQKRRKEKKWDINILFQFILHCFFFFFWCFINHLNRFQLMLFFDWPLVNPIWKQLQTFAGSVAKKCSEIRRASECLTVIYYSCMHYLSPLKQYFGDICENRQ